MDVLEQVRDLRKQGLSPKQIAKRLSMPPATIAPLIRQLAAAGDTAPAPSRELVGCQVNATWSCGLSFDGHPDWPASDENAIGGGLDAVLVSWAKGRDRVVACAYLVDTYCLGVKNVIGPTTMDRSRLADFSHKVYSMYDDPPITAPLDLARQLVFGAVDFAHGLGFEPHQGFEAAVDHLGRADASSPITFGCDGVPHFMAGPYDNPDAVIKTLTRTVGKGNFQVTLTIGE
jgi:hypothetical protein